MAYTSKDGISILFLTFQHEENFTIVLSFISICLYRAIVTESIPWNTSQVIQSDQNLSQKNSFFKPGNFNLRLYNTECYCFFPLSVFILLKAYTFLFKVTVGIHWSHG